MKVEAASGIMLILLAILPRLTGNFAPNVYGNSSIVEPPFDFNTLFSETYYAGNSFFAFSYSVSTKQWCTIMPDYNRFIAFYFDWFYTNGTEWRQVSTDNTLVPFHAYGHNETFAWRTIRSYKVYGGDICMYPSVGAFRDLPFIKISPRMKMGNSMKGVELDCNSTLFFYSDDDILPKYVLVPNVEEPYEWSNPASSQNVTLLNPTNSNSMDDNYIAIYKNQTSDNVICISFAKRLKGVMIRETTEYIDRIHFNYNETGLARDEYVNFPPIIVSILYGVNSTNVTSLKSLLATRAHWSLSQLTNMSDTWTTKTAEYFENTRICSYQTLINDWSKTALTYSPALPKSVPTSYDFSITNGTMVGTLYYKQGTTISSRLTLDASTFFGVSLAYRRAKSVLDYYKRTAAENGFWTGTHGSNQNGSEVGTNYVASITHAMAIWYQTMNERSVLDYVKAEANYMVENSMEQPRVPRALVQAYLATRNTTYLSEAEKIASKWNATDGWTTNYYKTDSEIDALVDLYLATNNQTYKDWAQNRIQHWWASAQRNLLDVSQRGHIIAGYGYYLRHIGNDITNYNLTSQIQNCSKWYFLYRDDYGGQMQTGAIHYPMYSCHQEFFLRGILDMLIYLLNNNKPISSIYLAQIQENMEWTYGNNPLSFNFEDATYGGIKRKIDYNATSKQLYTVQSFVNYDQQWVILTWLRIFTLYKLMSENPSLLPDPHPTIEYYPDKTRSINFETDPYVRYVNATITSEVYANNKLALSVYANTGAITRMQVYCGNKGKPTAVYATNGTLSWSYNASTILLTLNVVHDGPANLLVDWRIPGDTNGDGKVDYSDLFDVSEAYGSHPSKPKWNSDCDLNWDGKVDASDLFDLSRNYGKTT